MEEDHPLDTAARVFGSQQRLGQYLGVTKQAVSQWKHCRTVPIKYCVPIECATGGAVSRRQLRPDDWFRIWPELVTKKYPAPKQAA